MQIAIGNLIGRITEDGGVAPPVPYSVAISFGTATKAFSVTNWNLAHTANTTGYSLNNLIRLDNGQAIAGLNLSIVTVLSVQATGGSTQAGTAGAAAFPANAAREYWYPVSGARQFNLVVPGGGLGTATITILSNVTIGTPPHQTIISVGGVEKQIADSSGTTIDDGNILVWEGVSFDANVPVIVTDGTGISAINAMIITFNND